MLMLKKTVAVFAACVMLTACASDNGPHIVQTNPNAPQVRLVAGIATQIEIPDSEHVQSVVIGNPGLATAEQSESVVNLTAKSGNTGDTNMIIRTVDDDGHAKVYQYRVSVQEH